MIRIEARPAGGVQKSEWFRLQDIAHQAQLASLPDAYRHLASAMVKWGAPGNPYYHAHIRPQRFAGNPLTANQWLWGPQVTTAYDGEVPVGFMYVIRHNVSGTLGSRALKVATGNRDYTTVREIAVLPEYQGQGVARELARTALSCMDPKRPVTAYVYPELTPAMSATLLDHGFEPTGDQTAQPFGIGNGELHLVRMLASSPTEVLATL